MKSEYDEQKHSLVYRLRKLLASILYLDHIPFALLCNLTSLLYSQKLHSTIIVHLHCFLLRELQTLLHLSTHYYLLKLHSLPHWSGVIVQMPWFIFDCLHDNMVRGTNLPTLGSNIVACRLEVLMVVHILTHGTSHSAATGHNLSNAMIKIFSCLLHKSKV